MLLAQVVSRNATCFPPKALEKGPPLFQHGNVVFQAHDVGWIVSGFFTIIAIVTSFWLINKHLQWYTNDNATPLLLIRDAYEAIILTAFFYLLLTYLSPDPEVQKAVFQKQGLSREADAELRRRGQPPKKWVFPLGFVKWKPQDGMFFLQLMKWGVLQYCVDTLAAVILNHIGLYCEKSLSPVWGHIYVRGGRFQNLPFSSKTIWQILSVISISVTIAMYCLFQLYLCVATELAPHRPVLKLFSVKAVVFLTFWQASFLSVLSIFGVVKDTRYMTAGDINIGWGAILETFEMSLFALLHVKAFSYKPYRSLSPNATRTPRLRSFAHAMDFRETFRELSAGLVYMWLRIRGAETDPLARRVAVLEGAFDKSREKVWREGTGEAKRRGLEVDKAVEVEVDGEKQWLGLGDDYGIQFERELEKRGYGRSEPEPEHIDANHVHNHAHERQQRSWWRSAYHRVSQNNPDGDGPRASSSTKNKSRSGRRTRRTSALQVRTYDDKPPPSILRTYHNNRKASRELPAGAQAPQIPGKTTSQNLTGLLIQDRYPFTPVPTTVVRSDTVLDRLFPNPSLRSDRGRTHASPSSQSHRTHYPLNAAPALLTQSVDAVRPVEVAVKHPASPITDFTQWFPAKPSALPAFPPPVQQPPDGADTRSPHSPSPKRSRRSSHRRESAHYQANLAQLDVFTSPFSEPKRIPTASPTEDHPWRAGVHLSEPSDSQRPLPVPPRPSRSGDYEAHRPRPLSSRSLRPRSKAAGRRHYQLYYLPDARSPPSTPSADQTLLRDQLS
ncbi:organic solute transporter Ostalpha-domain-containing protein [Multifurca ochricompacta]|uniref:Organic solute transporter Ostalpha-domain-containing protein n=1 Tax=Multifurca ochricompacta TaxID=376703 RepID=A0AAD4M459_9AGAM|nr:organic solute transporter Ostalpha-domain-containing protein [Multifurca ochricompacta]